MRKQKRKEEIGRSLLFLFTLPPLHYAPFPLLGETENESRGRRSEGKARGEENFEKPLL
jgi:hypothetical protein